MKDCLITFRSVTPAQRGEGVLRRGGYICSLQRTPRWMEEQGCGYCLKLGRSRMNEAVSLLREEQIAFRKVYYQTDGTNVEELTL